jgi:glycosyltransferase involved in cell wall biosynthesis
VSETKLKILAYIHMYQPLHNAGAEVMIHQILKNLLDRGHEVQVICRETNVESFEGIEIHAQTDRNIERLFAWADVVFTHLDMTKRAVRLCAQQRKPLVHLVHNDSQLTYNRVSSRGAQLLIPNSQWIKNSIRIGAPAIVVYPPTIPEKYALKPSGDAITLINMNESKGGRTFWQLARLLPERNFIGVKGAYGEQISHKDVLPNVTIYENTPDILQIYQQTRLLLMPSAYESWGRTAIEAACSGIPVIATPTPGLTESLGDSGTFVEHGDIAGYVEAIRALDNKTLYKQKSDLAKKRALDLAEEFHQQIQELEDKLLEIHKGWYYR